MNTLTQDQAMDISGEHSLDWYHYGDEIHAALNEAFALGVAQGIQQEKDRINSTIPQYQH